MPSEKPVLPFPDDRLSGGSIEETKIKRVCWVEIAGYLLFLSDMANRLAHENSLYLRQHANNPVDWYPWGEDALAKAREENKPLLLSIGYSSCHWCHVMARESFANEYIAELMNRHFVCIKIDREERPDLDSIYMEAVQMVAQHGGWPLHAFCLPDGRPFFGGTYFPPDDRDNGMIPWPQLLMRVADFYRREKSKLIENADNIVHNLEAMNVPKIKGAVAITPESLGQAVDRLLENFDEDFGGFGEAPKFPPAMTLRFLLEYQRLPAGQENQSRQEGIEQAVETTLRGMAHGGLYDQIGGGFARYSVDRFWLIPHFEKMLSDNGLLLSLYVRAGQRFKQPLYPAIARETADWLIREMKTDGGLLSASLDADSEGEEGRFYVWTPEQIAALIPDQAKAFCSVYNITDEGNFSDGRSQPALVESDFGRREALAEARLKLLEARNQRTRPNRDDKILLSWNALALEGLGEAGFYLQQPRYGDLAVEGLDFIWNQMRQTDGRFFAVWTSGGGQGSAFLDDYAYYAQALLALASTAAVRDPSLPGKLIARAEEVVRVIEEEFRDPEGIGYYFVGHRHERLIARKKEWWDNATPSGQSVLLHVFSQLHALTGQAVYGESFRSLRRAYPGYVHQAGSAIPHALTALVGEMAGWPVVKIKGPCDWEQLGQFVRSDTWQKIFLLPTDDPAQPEGLQVCLGSVCLEPVCSIEELAALFGR